MFVRSEQKRKRRNTYRTMKPAATWGKRQYHKEIVVFFKNLVG